MDWHLARIWTSHAKLGVTMHDLETVYCLADLNEMHQALDVLDELDRRLRAKAQGVEQVRPKGAR